MPRKVLLALVLLYLVVQGLPFLEGFRTTPDDVAYHAIAMGGERHFWAFVHRAAQTQGRIVHYLDVPVTLLAAYCAENLYFRVFYTGLHFLTLALFALFIARLSGRAIGVLLLIVLVSFQPLDYFHLPPNAYPFHVSLPVFLILVSRIRLLEMRRHSVQGFWRTLPWHAMAFAGVMFGEGALLFFVALVAMEMVIERPTTTQAGVRMTDRLVARVRSYRGEGLVVLLFAVLYLSYRRLHPSTYSGNQLPHSLDVAAFGKTMLGHVYGGTSLSAMVRNADRMIELVPTMGMSTWVGAALVFLVVTALWWRGGRATDRATPAEPLASPWPVLLLMALFGAALVTSPVALVSRFQRWCTSIHACLFHDSRLSYYFTGLALTVLILTLVEWLRRRGSSGAAAARGVALLVGAAAALTYLNNAVRALDMRDYAAGWSRARVVACLETDDLTPSALAALIDPRRRLTMHPTYDRDIYWSQYVRHLRAGGLSCEAHAGVFDLFPLLPTGARLATKLGGPGVAYLGDGWSRPEAGHVWSQGRDARLWLPLSREQRGVRLELAGFVVPQHPRQRVMVLVGQGEARAFVIDKPGTHFIDIPVDPQDRSIGSTQPGQLVAIDLLLPDAVSPGELGMGSDQRKLAVNIVGLSVY